MEQSTHTLPKNKRGRPMNKGWTWKRPTGKPPRPLSAYNLFFKDTREQLMEQKTNTDPDWVFGDLERIISSKWEEMTEADRMKYKDLAIQEKEKYEIDLDVWRKQQEQHNEDTLSDNINSDNSSTSSQNHSISSLKSHHPQKKSDNKILRFDMTDQVEAGFAVEVKKYHPQALPSDPHHHQLNNHLNQDRFNNIDLEAAFPIVILLIIILQYLVLHYG